MNVLSDVVCILSCSVFVPGVCTVYVRVVACDDVISIQVQCDSKRQRGCVCVGRWRGEEESWYGWPGWYGWVRVRGESVCGRRLYVHVDPSRSDEKKMRGKKHGGKGG